jgi:hypothetical protein
MAAFDERLNAYLNAIREACERVPGINHEESEFRTQPLSSKTRRGRYPRELIVEIYAKIVTHDGYTLMITQQDVVTRSHPLAIPTVRYRCFGPDGQPCWWLETPNRTTRQRHFQKTAHDHVRVRHIDIQKLTSLDPNQKTLEQLREADLREKSWERFPHS